MPGFSLPSGLAIPGSGCLCWLSGLASAVLPWSLADVQEPSVCSSVCLSVFLVASAVLSVRAWLALSIVLPELTHFLSPFLREKVLLSLSGLALSP